MTLQWHHKLPLTFVELGWGFVSLLHVGVVYEPVTLARLLASAGLLLFFLLSSFLSLLPLLCNFVLSLLKAAKQRVLPLLQFVQATNPER